MTDYYRLHCRTHDKVSGETKNFRRLELGWKHRAVILPLIAQISGLLEIDDDDRDYLYMEEPFIREHQDCDVVLQNEYGDDVPLFDSGAAKP